jgi:hypothetical protein
MAAFVTVLFACFLASHARAVPPAAAGLAELQAALGEGGLEDAQVVGLALRRLGLATMLEVGLLDAAERLELTEHLKTAEISLGDRARLRRVTALTGRAHKHGDPTESPEMWEQDPGRALTRPYISDRQAQMRRAQQDGRDESATNTQLNNQAEAHAGTAQPGIGQASGSGISSDSASSFASNNLSLSLA